MESSQENRKLNRRKRKRKMVKNAVPAKRTMAKWGYGDCYGPDTWGIDFPTACGARQSPIDIIVKDTIYDSDLSKNKLNISIDSVHSNLQTLHFTGHNFKVETSTNSMTVTGAPGTAKDLYKLAQYHFHWGNSETENGSEHQIDSKDFPSELHLVHFNSTKYDSLSEACCKSDGLLVLGVFIEIGDEHSELQQLVKYLADIRCGNPIDLKENEASLNIRNLLPKSTDRYFTYPGSLTTPPCYESVTWVVFEQPISMSQEQLIEFQKVHDDDCKTALNFRPVCPLNDRKVKRSFP